MVAPEVHIPDRSIQDALMNDARRPKLVESLPTWMSRDAHVRFGDEDIRLDEARLPRLDGIMGAVHMIRKGQVEPGTPHVQVQYSPSPDTANRQSPFGMLLAFGPEIAALTAGAAAFLFSRNGKRLRNAGLAFGNVEISARILSACGAEASQTPPAIMTEVPATARPIETSTPSLGNEVLTGTPSAAPEAPAPVGGAYPSEVSGMTDPKVYSYGGDEGRANMNEYTRAMFDRYIAEMGPERGGFLTGATVEELYRSFDSGYDFKLYTTDTGLVWLVQSKSDGSFLVPKNQDGQIFRDLQLSYDYLFQSGAAVPVGTDNFDFQKFQANRVGFVDAWPVLVSVDAQNVPVSWVNMEQGGATAPIVLASATSTLEAAPTAIPDSRIELVIGEETFRVTTDVLHSEEITNLTIDASKVQKIGDILVYADASGRFLWHIEQQAWAPEYTFNPDFKNPELSPLVPLEAYEDGSAALSAELYMAEHPGLIEPDAPIPHYMLNFENGEGYHISLIPTNRNAFPADKITNLTGKSNKPFEYLGLQQTKDSAGHVIYVVVKENANPVPGNESQTLPTFHGFDKAAYEEWIQYPLILKFLANDPTSVGQLLPIFPAPPGSYAEPASTYAYWGQPPNPYVRALNGQDAINIFPADIQAAITAMYANVGEDYDPVTNPKSIFLAQLPDGLSRMILYTATEGWR